MPPSMKSLGLDRLTPNERIQLAQELWDSVAGQSEALSLTEDQIRELGRRIDAHEKDPTAGSPWQEVLARLRGSRT